MTTDVETEEIYWCISQSMESESYESNPKPLPPWQGKLQKVIGSCTTYFIRHFNEKTGVVDHDSNATAIVTTEGFWKDKRDADKAYMTQFANYIAKKEEELQNLENELIQFERSIE